MFLFFSKALPLLVYPPGLTIALLLLAAAAHKRLPKFAGVMFAVAVVTLYVLSIQPIADALQQPLEAEYPAITIDALPRADAVVVLGGYLHPRGGQRASPELSAASD